MGWTFGWRREEESWDLSITENCTLDLGSGRASSVKWEKEIERARRIDFLEQHDVFYPLNIIQVCKPAAGIWKRFLRAVHSTGVTAPGDMPEEMKKR